MMMEAFFQDGLDDTKAAQSRIAKQEVNWYQYVISIANKIRRCS